jgi:universal stress protein A
VMAREPTGLRMNPVEEARLVQFPYRRILNPIDFSENSFRAVDVAAGFACQNDGTVFLLYVVPAFERPTELPTYVPEYSAEKEVAREKLEEIAYSYLRGVNYEILTDAGNPARAILRAAVTVSSDVIIMTTHGRTGFSRAFFGSVAEDVLREAPCPVITIH